MTQPGYLDYARVNLAAGFLLGSGNQIIHATLNVFQGYVGAWPFINTFWNAAGGTDNYSLLLQYYSDDTFSTQIAEQVAVRNSNVIAWRQYAVLSPYVIIGIIPVLGNDTVPITFEFFGATSPSSSAKLSALDTDLLDTSLSVAATTTAQIGLTHIVPGKAICAFHSNVNTTWIFEIQRWDIGSASWKDFFYLDENQLPFGGTFEIALPDAQVQVAITNSNAAAKTFRCYIVAGLD